MSQSRQLTLLTPSAPEAPSPAVPLPEIAVEVCRDVLGCPPASDEVLKSLSSPPLVTAFPNPAIGAVLAHWHAHGHPKTEWTPGILDSEVSEGKNDPLYFAHYYPTKVPPAAIVPYILHYTRPGEVVLDAFAGTGMTGIAAQLCAVAAYAKEHPRRGMRRAVLVDLSATATFISATTNRIGDLARQLPELSRWVAEIEAEAEWALRTRHVGWARGGGAETVRRNRPAAGEAWGTIQYVVWSDVFSCPHCGARIVFWDLVFRGPGEPEPDPLTCGGCCATVSTRSLERRWTSVHDPVLGETRRIPEQVPVMINYTVGKKRFEKLPDEQDLAVIARCRSEIERVSLPCVALPDGFNTEQPRKSHNFTHVHHFFTDRNLLLMGAFWRRIKAEPSGDLRRLGLFLLTGSIQRVARLNRYMPVHDRHVGPLSGTLYLSQLIAEVPATRYLTSRIDDLRALESGPTGAEVLTSTQSATDLRNIPSDSIDYIFTDPPFGSNLNYSELNTMVEAWLGVSSDTLSEAIVNETQRKGHDEYRVLMAGAFAEYFRVLRPGRYITIEFHNSENRIWNLIQEAVASAGFVVAQVATLDKKKGTTKQLSYASTVQQDLVITAYKPAGSQGSVVALEEMRGSEVWAFVREHLSRLAPVRHGAGDEILAQAERQPYMLFDRLIARCVSRGIAVPMDASDFYAGLAERLPIREGMYFLEDQVSAFDIARSTARSLRQLEMFVQDENSARAWVRARLLEEPRTFQDLQPQYMKVLRPWSKHEEHVELQTVLEQSFLRYDANVPAPVAIARAFPGVAAGAVAPQYDGVWYVPDASDEADLERLRTRTLLREFEAYRLGSERRLKRVRSAALRVGMKALYQRQDYASMVAVAERVPEAVLEADEQVMFYVDVARTRLGEGGAPTPDPA